MKIKVMRSKWDDDLKKRIDYREEIEIPEGAWAVIVIEKTNTDEGVDGEYVYHSENTGFSVEYLDDYERVVIGERTEGSYLFQKIIFWSQKPFLVVETEDYFDNFEWVRLATQVGPHGLTRTFPELRLPTFYKTHAGEYGHEDRPTKWCRLTELAELVGLPPKRIIELHRRHFEGFHEGIHIIRANTPEELEATEKLQTIWTFPDRDELLVSNLENVWVRFGFARTVMYFELVGWHDQSKTAAAE